MRPNVIHLRIAILSVIISFAAVGSLPATPGDLLDSAPLAFNSPRDLDVASDGSLWVVDSGAQRAVHLTADGSAVSEEIDTRAFGANEPTGVAVASDGTLFIVDRPSLTVHHRNADGTVAASLPTIDLDALFLEDPLGIDILASGNFVILDGVDGTETVYEISSDGLSVVSDFGTFSLGLTAGQGVTAHPDGSLWISEADTTTLYHTDTSGTSLGTVDLAGLGMVEPRGLAAASDGTLWTIDVDSATLYHHTTGGAATGSPSSIALSDLAGLGLMGVTGVSRDPYGNPWVIDGASATVHCLSEDGSSSQFSFDVTPWGSVNEIDIAPDGQIYLTDASTSTVSILTPDASSTVATLSAGDLGASEVSALAVDPDGTLWVLDPTAPHVYHRSGDGLSALGGFAINPATVPNPRDIEVSPIGTLWFANAQATSSTLVQLERDGTANALLPSIAIGATLGITSPQSIAIFEYGDILISDSLQAVLLSIEGPPPSIAQAIHVDLALPLGVSASDELVLVFDQPVTLGGTLESDDLTLSETGDSLGTFSAASNPLNPTHVTLTLGAGASLTIPGSGAGSSAIDVSATIEPGDIVDASTGTDVAPTTARDIQFNFIPSGAAVIDSAGGSISVVDSADAVYREHTLTIAAGAVTTPTAFAIDIPSLSTGLVNAVEVSPFDFAFANGNSTLTMQYTQWDLFNGDGGDEPSMRIHQLFDLGGGSFLALPVPGLQTVDVDADTVTAPMPGTAPLGGVGPGLFATLPLDTVDDRSITIIEAGGGEAPGMAPAIGDDAVLTMAAGGLYPLHSISFPGYMEAAAGITITVREATVFQRFGFPVSSGAIIALESTTDIPTPVEIIMEFRPDDGTGDVVDLNGAVGDFRMMRLARRLDLTAPFDFVDQFPASVQSPTVITGLVTPLTVNGMGIYGLAVNANATIPVELSIFGAD